MRSGKSSLGKLSILFFPLTFAVLAVGHFFPMVELGKDFWIYATLGYCFVAAVLPVSLLATQFSGAGFLAILVVGVLGMLVGRDPRMPAFTGWESEKLGMLVPFLSSPWPAVPAVVFIALFTIEPLPSRSKGEWRS